jgi:YVTN family beta-propeller protein
MAPAVGLLWFTALVQAQAPPATFVNFEGAQTNPIRMSADGTVLFAVNTPNATVTAFNLANPAAPVPIVEIPVGIEPVSVNVNPANDDEAWVVNQISNSISVVSVSQGIVTDTIYCKVEPSDVVFANGNAFVSVARSNLVNVYSIATHTLVQSIPLAGEEPRALAVSPDGSTVYVAFALSGNHTTIIPDNRAPAPPAPTNPNLPPPPQVGLIVDASNPAWTRAIKYTMPDNDVAAISAISLTVTGYFPHLGTVNLGLTVNPQSGIVYVANTDALNLVMFETALNGHIVNHQITSVNPANGRTQIVDLNPNIDYSTLPNPQAIASALAMPTAIVFEPTGRYLYIAAFGTDRVGVLDTNAGTASLIEIDPQAIGATVNPVTKRGPRGLALNAANNLLYVLNRISNTISIVNLASSVVTSEIPTGSFDPTPEVIRNGRGFLYDHKLSGNGTGACASCHIDAEMDLLAWNLGNPGGDMTILQQGKNALAFHPMKGPMTTQTLRGLFNEEPYHWRGDKPDFAAFNGAFAQLLGGPQLSDVDMAAFTNFINTIAYQPNPNQNLDRTLPTALPLPDYSQPGDAAAGQEFFLTQPFNPNSKASCNFCHTSDPGPGTDGIIDQQTKLDTSQPLKHSQLRNMYQKTNANFNPGAVSIDGFAFTHDGDVMGVFDFLGGAEFPLIKNNAAVKANLDAYMLSFDTGTAPAVGYSRTLTAANVLSAPAQSDWNLLQGQAGVGNVDLIANGAIQGQIYGLLYLPATGVYQTDTTGVGPFTQAQLTTFIQNGGTLTIMGVPQGSGVRMGIDRNLDGVLNGDARPKARRAHR